MKRTMHGGLSLLGWLLVLGRIGMPTVEAAMSTYTNMPFEHFAVILDRMPFGVPPPVVEAPRDPEPELPSGPTPEEREFYQRHRLVALTRTGSGIGVGFVDMGQRPPKNYFAHVGETVDGYAILNADFAAETVTIRKGEGVYDLKLGQETTGPSAARQPDSPAAVRGGPRSATTRAPPSVPGANDEEGTSYVERMRQRREALLRQRREDSERQRQDVETQVERLTGEALQRHLREYNMQLIRAGGEMGPPLPIELTPEEDAQLVDEGVLPPVE